MKLLEESAFSKENNGRYSSQVLSENNLLTSSWGQLHTAAGRSNKTSILSAAPKQEAEKLVNL